MRASLSALLLTIGLVLVVVLTWCEHGRLAAPAHTWVDVGSIHEEGRQLDETSARLRPFQAVLLRMEVDLLKGTRTQE